MKIKNIQLPLSILVLVFLLACTTTVQTKTQTTELTTTTIELEQITPETLSTHNSDTDCWVGFEGKVYDLTDWLEKHPGGSLVISKHCGTEVEFTNAFIEKHARSKVDKLDKVGTIKGDLE